MPKRTHQNMQSPSVRSALLAERASVLSAGRGELDVLNSSGVVSLEDQAPVLHDQFLALHRHGLDRRKLKLIDSALDRLDRGVFGLCEECGGPVSPKRLQVIPWAAYCIACQERFDTEAAPLEPELELIA
jgi:DnaK suppressor protein